VIRARVRRTRKARSENPELLTTCGSVSPQLQTPTVAVSTSMARPCLTVWSVCGLTAWSTTLSCSQMTRRAPPCYRWRSRGGRWRHCSRHRRPQPLVEEHARRWAGWSAKARIERLGAGFAGACSGDHGLRGNCLIPLSSTRGPTWATGCGSAASTSWSIPRRPRSRSRPEYPTSCLFTICNTGFSRSSPKSPRRANGSVGSICFGMQRGTPRSFWWIQKLERKTFLGFTARTG